MAKSSNFSLRDAYGFDGFDEDDSQVDAEYFKHDDAIAARAVKEKQIDYADFYSLQAKSKTRHAALYDGVISGKIKVV
jgi:hypothetical protein